MNKDVDGRVRRLFRTGHKVGVKETISGRIDPRVRLRR